MPHRYRISTGGARNDASGAVTLDDDDCNFVLSGSDNTGGILSASNAGSTADPAFAAPTAEQCTFTFEGDGDTDLATQDGTGGTQEVWLDDDTLEPGIHCKTGPGNRHRR